MERTKNKFEDTLFIKNLKVFLFALKKKQEVGKYRKLDFANKIGVDVSTISGWLNNSRNPIGHNLSRIAQYVSTELNIPYELFEDGQALLEKDFEKLLSERSLQDESLASQQSNSIPQKNIENRPPVREFTIDEEHLIVGLRKINSSEFQPLDSHTVYSLLELIDLIKINSPKQKAIIELLKSFREDFPYGPTYRGGDKDNKEDKKK